MSIADIVNTSNTAAAAKAAGSAAAAAGTTQLEQNEFLKLMLAQLKHQDPFKAMDPTQFLGQLAQFSTVTGIQQMNNAFTTLSESMRATQVLDGATMVGREVLVDGSEVQLGATDAITGAVDLPTGTTAAQLNVFDAAGQLVRRMPLEASAGLNDFTWDGTDDLGERAPAGTYYFEAVANVAGKSESLSPLVSTRVSSVTIDPNGSGLMLNTPALGSVALSQVRRVM